MPNHVMNIIKMKGITKLPLFSERENGEYSFDFNKLIPMPESLSMTSGSSETLAITFALEQIVNSLKGTSITIRIGSIYERDLEDRVEQHLKSEWNKENSREELIELGIQYLRNAALYGSTSWYDWCVRKWGTKWNAYEYYEISEDEICFETAWSMPEPVIEKLAEMYPDVKIEHWWADEDMGNNSGYYVYHKGGRTGGYDNTDHDAYENYVKCWGETNCLYKDENGKWKRKSCEECKECY